MPLTILALDLGKSTCLESWEPPSVGTVKMNVDEGSFEGENPEWGMVVRNHSAEVS